MEPAWIAAILNGGAMVILAYHFLVGLPAILERIAKDQQAERQFWANEGTRDREEFARRAEVIAAALRAHDDKVVNALLSHERNPNKSV
jgi:adenylate kinase